MVARNHRLRERRDKIGWPQFQVARLMGESVSEPTALVYISKAERGMATPRIIELVRRALVRAELMERERRQRPGKLERALSMPRTPAAERFIIDYMIDALRAGEEAEYDRVALLVGTAIAKLAGDEYLDGI